MVRTANHLFGPAGLLEQDDGENWSQTTRAAGGVVGSRLGQFLEMGLGQDEVSIGPDGERYIDTQINEHGQRWFYRGWRDWLAAESWAELTAGLPPLPEGRL